MLVYRNLSMTCIVCMLLYLTKNIRSNKSGTINRKYNREESLKTLKSLREIIDDPNKRTSRSDEHIYVNQTEKLLEATKRNLILSFGLRKNMLHINSQIRRRPLHNYISYIYDMYQNLSKHGLSSFKNVGGCGMDGTRRGLGLPLPALVNTVRGCADIGDNNESLADFPHIPFKFDISEIPPSEIVFESKLKIIMQPHESQQRHSGIRRRHQRFMITLYVVIDPKPEFPRLLKVRSKQLEIIKGQHYRWLCFDTSNFLYGIPFQDSSGTKNYVKFVLKVSAMDTKKTVDPSVLGFYRNDGEDTKKALLVLFAGDQNESKSGNLRKKRGVAMSTSGKKNRKKNKNRKHKKNRRKNRKNKKNCKRKHNRPHGWCKKPKPCKRKSMIVDFQRFQWTNWLVSPISYDAYHCHGACRYPIPSHLHSTNHAIIQALVHSQGHDFVPQPCCVPDEFEVIYLLSLDGPDRVVLKKKEGLIAKSCVCK